MTESTHQRDSCFCNQCPLLHLFSSHVTTQHPPSSFGPEHSASLANHLDKGPVIQLREHIKDVASHLAELESVLAQYDSTYMPILPKKPIIQNFPPELLMRIMLIALGIPPEGDEVMPMTLDSKCITFTPWRRAETVDTTNSGAWALSQVCQTWRNAALECSRVWSYVYANFGVDESPSVKLMDLYLARSRSHHLYVRIDSEYPANTPDALGKDPALQRLFLTANRWRSVTVWVNAHEVGTLLSLKGNIPDLRMFKFTINRADPILTQVTSWSEVFRQLFCESSDSTQARPATKLEFLNAGFWTSGVRSFDVADSLPLTFIQHLSISNFESSFLEGDLFLPKCSRLTALALNGLITLTQPIELPNLQSLDIAQLDQTCIETFALLTVKSLQSLAIAIGDIVESRDPSRVDLYLHYLNEHAIPAFQCKRLARLMIIATRDHELSSYSLDLLQHLFRLIPSIKDVTFICATLYPDLGVWNFVEVPKLFALFDANSHQILPCLKHLHVECQYVIRGKDFSYVNLRGKARLPAEFFQMMESRTGKPKSDLTTPEFTSLLTMGDETHWFILEGFTWRSNLRLRLDEEEQKKIDRRVKGGFRFETILISHREANSEWIAMDNHF
jgi:hypothetical protein